MNSGTRSPLSSKSLRKLPGSLLVPLDLVLLQALRGAWGSAPFSSHSVHFSLRVALRRMMESCLGEESVQMWELNRRLEAYLSRVKSLEEQNERLRLEIGNLREKPGEPSWRSRAEEELGALRALLDQRWSEKHAAEVARDNLLEEVEGVASRCQQQRLARERAKEQVAESRRVLEAEKWAGVCLGNQAAELEKELEALVTAHEQERAGMSAQVARSALGLETFRRVPDNAPAPDVQDLARTFGEAWRGAVEGYQARVACLEASLGQARERLGQAMQGTREGQREAQRLDVERAALQGRREMLEQRLEGQWQEQQEAGEKFQLTVEALEQEKQDLHNQIAQVLEDRQQLTHLKMSLSLEVATYRTLLEAESSRLNTSNIDSKATITFPDPKMELCIPVTPEIRHPGPWPPVLSPTSLPMVDTPRTPMPTFLKSQGFLPTQTPTLASTPIPPISQAHHPGTRREVQGQVATSYLLQGPSSDGPKPKDSEHLAVPKLPWAKAKVGIGVGSSPEPQETEVEKQQVLSFPCPDELVEQVEDKKIVLVTDSSIDPLETKDGEEEDEELNDFSSPQPPAPEPRKYQEKVGKEIQGVAEEEDEAKETITENLEEEAWQKGGALDKEEIQETPGTSDEKVQETFGTLSGKTEETLNLPGEEVQETQKLPSEEFQEIQIFPGEEIQETPKLPTKEFQEIQILPGEEVLETPKLPTEEFQEIQILPGELIQETQKLPDEEIQETHILPSEEIQKSQKLPTEGFHEIQILPGEEILETQQLPSKEGQETQILLAEEIKETQILLAEEIKETQILPDEEIQESQILPDEEIQETQILPDEEIRETQILPDEEIQETQILPDEEIQVIQNLPTDENQEILGFPGEEKQEILMSLEKETRETLRSLEDNEETLNSPKEGNLAIGENQETIGFPGEKKQETVSPLEEGVLEKENGEALGSPKENNQEIVSSPEGDLEREDNQEIQGPPEEDNEEILKPLKGDLEREEEKSGFPKEEIQEMCFSEKGNQEKGEMQKILSLPVKEIQETLTSLDEGNLEMEENQEVPEEGKGDLERKENQETLQSLEVESLHLQKPEDVAEIGQDHSTGGDENAPWETGKDHEETAKRKPEKSSLEGNWEVVEEAGLRYGGPGESQHTGEEEQGSQESEQQRFPTKETTEEGMTKSPQVEFKEVESTELETLNCVPKISEQMFEEDGASRESDGEAPEDNGSITGLEPSEGEEVRNQEQLKKEVSESENWKEGLSEPHHREVILEPSLEQGERETGKDVQETNELNQQYSKLLMENETLHPHLEAPEVLEELEQRKSLGMGEDSTHPSDPLPAETTIVNNVDEDTTTQSSLMGQGKPQEIKQEVGVSEDLLETHFRAEGNEELWESWETEDKTKVSEELVREIGKVNAQDSSAVFQEEVEESEGDDLSETLPDSTPLGLYSREPDSPSWGMIGKEQPSPQEENNEEAWDPPPRHAEVNRAQPDEGEDGAPDSDVSEEFEDLAVDASLLPGGPGRLVETVGHGSELVLDPPTWDRDGESDGFADEEESGEEEEDGDDDDDDDDDDERVEGIRHWKLGPSLGSPVRYLQEGEPEEDRERNADAPSDAGGREGAENPPPATLEVEKVTKPLGRPKSLDSDIQSDSEEEHSHITEDQEDSGPEEELETPLAPNQGLLGVSDLTPLDKEDQASDSDLIEIPCRVDDSARKAGASLNGGGPTMDQPDSIRGEILNGLGKLQAADQGKQWDLEREGGEGKAPGEELSSQTLWSGGPLILGQSPFLKFTQAKEEDGDSWSSGDE